MSERRLGCHAFENGDLGDADLAHVLPVQFMLKSFTYQLHDLGQVTSLGPFQLSDPINMQWAHLFYKIKQETLKTWALIA